MKNFLKKALMITLPLLGGIGGGLLSSCENEDNWQPGEPVAEGNKTVYFSSENSAVVGHLEGETGSFYLTIDRQDTEGELTVPIVVTEKVGEMDVPQTVTFADGEDETRLVINYTYTPGMYLSLGFGAGYGNPYLAQDGTITFKCNIAKLKPLCRVNYREDSKLGGVESAIYSYDGMNRFRFTNFMDSRIDVDFTVSTAHNGLKFNPENLRSLRGDFVPVSNSYEDSGSWYLYDSSTGEYPVWTPQGWDKSIYYYMYWAYQDDYAMSYSYIDFRKPGTDGKDRESYFWASYVYYDADATDYSTLNVYYTLDFNL